MGEARLSGRQETLAQGMVFHSPALAGTAAFRGYLLTAVPLLVSASPVSTAHPDCAAAGTRSPSISTSASSAAMMGPDPSRPPERSREKWRA